MVRMESLMVQVNDKFRHFFASMGYAGEVQLHQGSSENDFANYGIDILVKFRDNMPLQKLDPFRQSGANHDYWTG
jgi:chromosome segregation ATPase